MRRGLNRETNLLSLYLQAMELLAAKKVEKQTARKYAPRADIVEVPIFCADR